MNAHDAAAAGLMAAWAAAASGGLFGLAGFVVGLVGLHHARQAKESAAAANLIAKDANALANSANAISEASNQIASKAHEVSRQAAARENELHDVTWDWSWGKDAYEGMVEVQNVGKSLARDVTIQFKFDDATEASTHAEITGRETCRLQMPGLREALSYERQRRAASIIKRDTNGSLLPGFKPFSKPMHQVRLRVTWRTPLGASKHFDSETLHVKLPE